MGKADYRVNVDGDNVLHVLTCARVEVLRVGVRLAGIVYYRPMSVVVITMRSGAFQRRGP